MKSKDQMLLEEAYNKVAVSQNEPIEEGVWSQIKGLGSGIAAGVKTGAQNLAAGAAKAVGVKVDDTNRQTMGQSFAKAQQGSMLKGFQTSAEKTVNDFINDAKKMGVDLNDPNIAKQFPEAAAAFKDVQNLLKYVKNPTTAPVAPASAPASSAATTSGTSSAATTTTPTKTGPARDAKGRYAKKVSSSTATSSSAASTTDSTKTRPARSAKKTSTTKAAQKPAVTTSSPDV